MKTTFPPLLVLLSFFLSLFGFWINKSVAAPTMTYRVLIPVNPYTLMCRDYYGAMSKNCTYFFPHDHSVPLADKIQILKYIYPSNHEGQGPHLMYLADLNNGHLWANLTINKEIASKYFVIQVRFEILPAAVFTGTIQDPATIPTPPPTTPAPTEEGCNNSWCGTGQV